MSKCSCEYCSKNHEYDYKKNPEDHNWGKWSDLKYYWDGVYTQRRHCKECNFGEMREIKIKA